MFVPTRPLWDESQFVFADGHGKVYTPSSEFGEYLARSNPLPQVEGFYVKRLTCSVKDAYDEMMRTRYLASLNLPIIPIYLWIIHRKNHPEEMLAEFSLGYEGLFESERMTFEACVNANRPVDIVFAYPRCHGNLSVLRTYLLSTRNSLQRILGYLDSLQRWHSKKFIHGQLNEPENIRAITENRVYVSFMSAALARPGQPNELKQEYDTYLEYLFSLMPEDANVSTLKENLRRAPDVKSAIDFLNVELQKIHDGTLRTLRTTMGINNRISLCAYLARLLHESSEIFYPSDLDDVFYYQLENRDYIFSFRHSDMSISIPDLASAEPLTLQQQRTIHLHIQRIEFYKLCDSYIDDDNPRDQESKKAKLFILGIDAKYQRLHPDRYPTLLEVADMINEWHREERRRRELEFQNHEYTEQKDDE